MKSRVILAVLIGFILFSANIFVLDAYAMTKADLIASITEKTSSGKKIRSHGAHCIVTDSDGNEYGSDYSNRVGIIHIKMYSSDENLPTHMKLSCEKPGLAGESTFEINHKRFIKASVFLDHASSNTHSFFDVFFDIFTIDSFFDILSPLQDFHERTGGADSFFDIFVEVDVIANQQCPPGQVVVGIDNIGKIICEELNIVSPPPACQGDCSNHGTCVVDNLCRCDQGWNGDDCSVPDEPACQAGGLECNATCVDPQTDTNNCGFCGNTCSGGINALPICNGGICQLVCDPGFFMDNTGQCTLTEDPACAGIALTQSCSTGQPGVCALGTQSRTCTNGQISSWDLCQPTTQPSEEICDGLDNDCDGTPDEGNPDSGALCNTGLSGVCSAGAIQCTNSQLTCEQTIQATPEIEDGLDNDCDGEVDEDFALAFVINEINYNLASGTIGDANCDGIRESAQDEFVEIVNIGRTEVDLTSYTLSDGSAIRHIFSPGTILDSGRAIVVFGGGVPTFDGTSTNTNLWCVSNPDTIFQIASTGKLDLSNDETVTFANSNSMVLDSHTYSSGGIVQSIVRVPEFTTDSQFVLHTSVSSIGPQSPGLNIDGNIIFVTP